eukprot:TRINITY_DN19927_c0_g1_i1.p1 TRINITY_DN19927_c0_g1~~TRINITY_DN19927_c0_g1_i1.p1  ORF type:complete len:470 (-),score=39.45 TRINITY_DN19927_c0_g1_i1:61-1470(-)
MNSIPTDLLRKQAEANELDLLDPKFSAELDKQDQLSHLRHEFLIPKLHAFKDGLSVDSVEGSSEAAYLCGNSLGLQPKATRRYVEEELKEWETRAVEGHFKHARARPWLTTDEYVLKQVAHIVGGLESEVVIMNSLTVNLHLMMVPFYRPTSTKFKVVIESRAFPSDLYAVQSQIRFHGFDPETALIELTPRQGEHTLVLEDILECIERDGDSIALILLAGVQYYTGQLMDIKTITAAGHGKGCVVGWDLAHAAGNVPLSLHDWNVDFACWCSYKYLNSGPGSIGGCFVHASHADKPELPRFAGWWGHELSTRFQMNAHDFKPISGAFGFRLSNPPVLCVAALLASVELFEKAGGMQVLRQKSLLLTAYLELLVDNVLAVEPYNIKIITPRDPSSRGCQLSLLFSQDVSRVSHLLTQRGVVCDERKPNVLRVSPTPLYNKFDDVRRFVVATKEVLDEILASASEATKTD